MERRDGAVSDPVVSEVIRKIRVTLTEAFSERNTSPEILRSLRTVAGFNSRELSRVLRVDVPADLGMREVTAQFVRENLRLVRGMADKAGREVEGVLTGGIGVRAEDLAAAVAERFQVAESRAALIARDQTLKVNGFLTRTRQQAAGVTEYEWVSSKDERVRPEHAEADGNVYRWDTPPAETGGFHPGEDINCRCTANPILPRPEADED